MLGEHPRAGRKSKRSRPVEPLVRRFAERDAVVPILAHLERTTEAPPIARAWRPGDVGRDANRLSRWLVSNTSHLFRDGPAGRAFGLRLRRPAEIASVSRGFAPTRLRRYPCGRRPQRRLVFHTSLLVLQPHSPPRRTSWGSPFPDEPSVAVARLRAEMHGIFARCGCSIRWLVFFDPDPQHLGVQPSSRTQYFALGCSKNTRHLGACREKVSRDFC